MRPDWLPSYIARQCYLAIAERERGRSRSADDSSQTGSDTAASPFPGCRPDPGRQRRMGRAFPSTDLVKEFVEFSLPVQRLGGVRDGRIRIGCVIAVGLDGASENVIAQL